MKASTGKVLMIAFGHPDNVLSLTKAIASEIDMELVFVVSGNEYKEGVLNIDLRGLAYGLNTYQGSLGILPEPIRDFLGSGFPLRFLRTHDMKFLKDKFLRNLRNCFHASRILKKSGFDVLHFNGVSGFIPYFTIFLGIKRKIWTLHDFISHSGEESFKAMKFQRLLVRYLHCEYIQHYQYLQKAFVEYYRLPAHLVHHVPGGYLSIFRAFKPLDTGLEPGFVLFYGRISKYKGIDYLIEAFKLLVERNKNIRLVIAGSGKLWFNFNPNEYPGIIFINRYIETGELVDLIKKSVFIVVPYTDATHSAVVATAFAIGKPVVATRVGGLPEVIEDGETGRLVSPGDAVALAGAIDSMLGNDVLLESMRLKIVDLCNQGRLSWSNIAEKMKHIYSIGID